MTEASPALGGSREGGCIGTYARTQSPIDTLSNSKDLHGHCLSVNTEVLTYLIFLGNRVNLLYPLAKCVHNEINTHSIKQLFGEKYNLMVVINLLRVIEYIPAFCFNLLF